MSAAAHRSPIAAVRRDYGPGGFPVNNGPEATLEEIGQAFGVTRERIRQVEAHALAKLRYAIGILVQLGEEEAFPLLESLKGRNVAAYASAFLSTIMRCGEAPSAARLRARAILTKVERELSR